MSKENNISEQKTTTQGKPNIFMGGGRATWLGLLYPRTSVNIPRTHAHLDIE